jgi:tripartite-type tricarboxylate transporter receptor subunit TctC
MTRRKFLGLTAGAMMLPAFARRALAQTLAQAYPSRPLRLIVPFPPGGPTDLVARPLAQSLAERLGQPVVIENRGGAGATIGTEAAVRSPPDGYTLLMSASSSAIAASLYDKLSYNFIRDIAPVAGLVRFPQVLVVHPSVPAKTVPELIAHAKANPGALNFASPGAGTGPHVTGELFKMLTGASMVHVPYRGVAPAMTDLVAGQVQVMFVVPVGLVEHIESGRLRALAVTTTTRSRLLPQLPTVDEVVQGYEASTWFGVGTPRQTPAEIIERLNREINACLAEPAMKARLADLDGTTLVGTPADFAKLIAEETEKWSEVVTFAGIKAE